MEIEDFILSTLVIGVLGGFILYVMDNPINSSIPVLETVAIGGLWAYLFNNPNLL